LAPLLAPSIMLSLPLHSCYHTLSFLDC